jgi:hypothetical protein
MLEHKMKAFDIEMKDEREGKQESGIKAMLTKEDYKGIGRYLVTSSGSAAKTLTDICSQGDIDDVHNFIDTVTESIINGDMNAAESLLVNQAYTLNAIFHGFIVEANKTQSIEGSKFRADIAFRAQNQCQRTLRTLLEFKSPKRSTFIKQQNNLQVNESSKKKKEKKVNPANELLEENHEARLDTGKAQEAVRTDSEVETLGELDRTQHGTG